MDERMNEVNEMNALLRKEKDNLLQNSKSYKDQIDNLKEELKSHNAELYEARERNTIMEEQKINNEAQINELQETCQILKERIYTEETLQQRCRDDLQNANNNIETLTNDLRGAMLVKEKLATEKGHLDAQLKQTQSELESAHMQAEKYNKQKNDYENRIQDYELALSK